MTAKEEILALIERLPDNATIEDAIERLVVFYIAEGRGIPHTEGATRIGTTGQWRGYSSRGSKEANSPVASVTWSPESLVDLEQIVRDLARESGWSH